MRHRKEWREGYRAGSDLFPRCPRFRTRAQRRAWWQGFASGKASFGGYCYWLLHVPTIGGPVSEFMRVMAEVREWITRPVLTLGVTMKMSPGPSYSSALVYQEIVDKIIRDQR